MHYHPLEVACQQFVIHVHAVESCNGSSEKKNTLVLDVHSNLNDQCALVSSVGVFLQLAGESPVLIGRSSPELWWLSVEYFLFVYWSTGGNPLLMRQDGARLTAVFFVNANSNKLR